MQKLKQNEIKSFIISALAQVKIWLMGLSFVIITWSIDLSLRPYILKVIIDRLQHVTKFNIIEQLSGPLILYSVISLFVILMFRFHDFLYLHLNSILKRYVGEALMQKMMRHSLSTFQNNFAGNLSNKVKDVMSGIPNLIKITDELLALLLGLIIATLTVWTISYQFSLLLIAWLAIFMFVTIYFAKHARQLSNEAAEVNSHVGGQLVDVLSNIVSIKLFASRKYEAKHLKKYLNEHASADQKRDRFFILIFSFQGLSFIIYQTIGFILLIYWYRAGNITVGDFVLLITINIAIINQLWSLSRTILLLTEIYGSVSQGLKTAFTPIDILDKPKASTLKVSDGKIEFSKVAFNYHGVSDLFKEKSIILNPGEKVGLVGYSGGGKSTFVSLILRLYDVNTGNIYIDGQDIQNVTQDSLHKNIAMIPQDPILFHRSLMENIRYGNLSASESEVIAAAKLADAHEFIMQLPNKYDSLVGERGVKLSGGQRQRIAIARAFLKNAPIVILDEATSQLDSITERVIQSSLWSLMQGKTTIVIAHRLSTLLHMDRILVFHHGKVIEDGSHKALIAQSGLYKRLWDTQIDGFLTDIE